MNPLEVAGLFLAAAAAGVINAVAGGGTLVTFPVLLAFGVPPVTANATSTVGLLVGTAGSMLGYRRHLETVRPWLRKFLPVSLLGGLVGSGLVIAGDPDTFRRLVPFLILFATLLFTVQGVVRRLAGARPCGGEGGMGGTGRPVAGVVLFQFAVAVYGGYFGAGIGILMLATFGFLGLPGIHEMNALKTVLGAVINVVAAVSFVVAGLVDWPRALVMTLGAFAGYWAGAQAAQRIPAAAVRGVVTVTGFGLAAWTFWKEFGGR
jgi:uncharacterized membrane protein YfcA